MPEAAAAMRPLVGPRSAVVPLQNGIEAPDQLAGVLGAPQVLGGLCRILALLEGPGYIRYAGAAPYIAFGERDCSRSSRVIALQHAFVRARGLTVEVPHDIRAAMWNKFIFISFISALRGSSR